ncbi:hypothetical protein SAMN04487850_0587 [Prevotella aff. ruminicola Tc2-24]|jgi:hypothetical protein|uniref:Sulfate transporter n=1 Tax=Prevotella aff. ruminicola Tc2-24 TaxID=81582 RepID=A0A1I0ME07_9BACT|nr:hypothetical protein SAMN04487850_0587 [Prevotella aff. ruminicola Tc2-24]
MEGIGYYLFVLAAIIVGFLVVKKVASCLIKTAVMILLVTALAVIYYLYFR